MIKKILAVIAVTDFLVAGVSLFVFALLCNIQQAAVMSSVSELEHAGAINLSQINVPRWHETKGAPLQQAEEFLLGNSGLLMYDFAWVPAIVLFVNGMLLLVLVFRFTKKPLG